MNPRRIAMVTAWVRSSALSLAIRLFMRALTVSSEMLSASATSRLLLPSATSRNTLNSRSVSDSEPR